MFSLGFFISRKWNAAHAISCPLMEQKTNAVVLPCSQNYVIKDWNVVDD